MTLPDLIDLEAQLARDRDVEPGVLEARDRALLAGGAPPRRRGEHLERWLQALREREPGRLQPGRSVAAALRLLRAALAVAGLLLGWGAATAVLQYTGDHPVNVWDVLLVFVWLQLLLLLLLLGSFFLPAAALGRPVLGLVRGAAAAIYPRLAARSLAADGRLEEWRALWHRLRSRRSLYHRVEPWLLLALTQGFGLAFNLGALAAFARLVAFSDIAFSWSTTLQQLDVDRFHGLVRALATPWAWLWPDAVPTRELVAATRYSRLEGAYLLAGGGRAARPDLVGAWWPFLVAAVACYGLLPRALALAAARLRSARLLARLPLDDAEISRVLHRLAEPHVETRSPAPPEVEPPAPTGTVPAGPPPPGAGACSVVLWRDVPAGSGLEAAVARQTGCTVGPIQQAGGRDFPEAGAEWASPPGGGPVVVVAEGWEAPDRGALRLLADLRRALGPRRHLLVLLVEAGGGALRPPGGDQVRLWREVTARLEDPFLSVEPLRGAP